MHLSHRHRWLRCEGRQARASKPPSGMHPDHHGPVDVIVGDHLRRQPDSGQDRSGHRGLPPLVSISTPAGQPFPAPATTPRCRSRPSGPPSRATARFMIAGLRRHHRDLAGRHVRRVDGQQIDPAPQVARQGVEQVPLGTPGHRTLRRGAAHRGGFDVGGVQLDPGQSAATAARSPRCRSTGRRPPRRAISSGPADQRLGTPPRHEHARVDPDPQAAELGPADDQLQRRARRPAPAASASSAGRAAADSTPRPRPRRTRSRRRGGWRPARRTAWSMMLPCRACPPRSPTSWSGTPSRSRSSRWSSQCASRERPGWLDQLAWMLDLLLIVRALAGLGALGGDGPPSTSTYVGYLIASVCALPIAMHRSGTTVPSGPRP